MSLVIPVQVKVVVLCVNSNGVPEFFTCPVNTTENGVKNGEHYDLACEQALREGFEKPMISFDKTDEAGKGLAEVAAWI